MNKMNGIKEAKSGKTLLSVRHGRRKKERKKRSRRR